MQTRIIPPLTLVTALLLGGTTHAEEADEDFIENASLEELEDEGYLILDIYDVETVAMHAHRALRASHVELEHSAAELAVREAAFGDTGFGEDLEYMSELSELLDALIGLEIIDFMPDETGGYDDSGWPSGRFEAGDVPGGDFAAGMPEDSDSLAADGWTQIGEGGDGSSVWQKTDTSQPGVTVNVTRYQDRFGNWNRNTIEVRVDAGGGYRRDTSLNSDGSLSIVDEKYGPDGAVTERAVHYVGPGQEEPPPPVLPGEDIEGLPPADGGEGVLCPLSLWQCRQQAEELENSDEAIYVAVSGFVFVDQGPDGAEEDEAPRLTLDPETLVSDPRSMQDPRVPPKFRISIPAVVLPPRPGT